MQRAHLTTRDGYARPLVLVRRSADRVNKALLELVDQQKEKLAGS